MSREESHTSSPAYINTKKVVEQTAASSLGNQYIYPPRTVILRKTFIFTTEFLRQKHFEQKKGRKNCNELKIEIFLAIFWSNKKISILNFVLAAARTIGVDPEKETQSPVRRAESHQPMRGQFSGHVITLDQSGGPESLYSNGTTLSRSESSSSDSVNSQDGIIQVSRKSF